MSKRIHVGRVHPGNLVSVLTTEASGASMMPLGWPGLDPLRPSLDINLFDSSGSVVSEGGTDPIGNRYVEAQHALKMVSQWCTTRRSLAAIVHFDQPSTGDSGVRVIRSELRALQQALKAPMDALGTSDLEPSLSHAEQLARRYPDHDLRLTVFSDFAITDDDPSVMFDRLAAFPGEVHAVVLNSTPPPDLWGKNIAITTLSHDDAPGTLAAALFRSLTATRRGRRLSPHYTENTRPSIPPLSPGRGSSAGPPNRPFAPRT